MANTNPLKYDIAKTYRVDEEFCEAVEELRLLTRKPSEPVPTASDIVRRAVLEMRDRERKRSRK
jgi:hypothetical protein